MEIADTYQIRLEIFEGPLDLLLFLIRKKKIDIHDIPIATITREYLEYLNHKERINLDREAEFLLMAALLIYIKSQMLLPRQQLLEEEDPRKGLVDRLLDYQKIKGACQIFREKEDEQLQSWKRTFLPPLSFPEELDLVEVSVFSLAESFFNVIKRRERDNIEVIKGKDLSVEKKMAEILTYLEENPFLDFLEYTSSQETIQEALVSFFCLLELIKARLVIAIQESLFQSIKVWLRKDRQLKKRR